MVMMGSVFEGEKCDFSFMIRLVGKCGFPLFPGSARNIARIGHCQNATALYPLQHGSIKLLLPAAFKLAIVPDISQQGEAIISTCFTKDDKRCVFFKRQFRTAFYQQVSAGRIFFTKKNAPSEHRPKRPLAIWHGVCSLAFESKACADPEMGSLLE
jgi:hypothetical protein